MKHPPHTKKPWWISKIIENEGGDEVHIASKGDRWGDHGICVVNESWSRAMLGNVFLILAAPEMLEILNKVLELDSLDPELKNQIKTIVDKATGEEVDLPDDIMEIVDRIVERNHF